ncbi:MAG: transglutaminase family protein [Gammaproteobacteria bacterium]|nr:transglutaminase family protein [Gammaproteobacteria bacterium]
MAIHVALRHITRYRFDRAVEIHPHVLRLRPAAHSRTPVIAYTLKMKPENPFINWQQDPFGNWLARLVFPERARELEFDVELIADMTVINPFEFFLDETAQHYPFAYGERLSRDLTPYLEVTENGPLLREWVASVPRTATPTVDFLVALNQRLAADIGYTIRMEPGVQTCEQTLELRRGSCRDSGWLLVQILRQLGMAARFVSGYLVQLKSDIPAIDGPSGPEEDFTDLHAWAEVYIAGAGWVGLDPTSGLFAGEGHIPLACTPEPSSAAPITGSTGVCEVEFFHSNTVSRIHEDPRVTKPYSDAQWQAVRDLGRSVDADLKADDVRLTMGGEPTFVSIDDMESAQWNIDADGVEKRHLAERLTRRMRTEFAPGGVLHYGQGKWYPGEALPRWQKACYWRRDGQPIWQRETLLAAPDRSLDHGVVEAQRFAKALVAGLGLPEGCLQAAHEDALYLLWQEDRLPPNVDPDQADLDDPSERASLLRRLQADLNAPVGYVLPLEHSELAGRWQSSPWPLRRGKLVLLPGDSPIGFRLPLDSLPWQSEKEAKLRLDEQPPDPFGPRGRLPAQMVGHPLAVRGSAAPKVKEQKLEPRRGGLVEGDRVVKTALCVEARKGVVHVFLPPLNRLEAWLELIALIEDVAALEKIPLVIEGYDPPRDPRLRKFAVTPDPGVIEVNIHPAENFDDLVFNTERLYELARECRLGTEKFMLDGRHTGTGGGNHVTLGGASPADSPLLRRPSLLRSLITYWQNHPALSYMFSGLFIGPTSQAPRVDEARDDKLYELEIAFSQLPQNDEGPPWLVDRALRHLLTDLTGNTHRSEFCIDKLYSPDSPTGRLGLLELRAFEMPPHARMSVVQMLLLRSLVALFWKRPLKRPLVHWGTSLHDRFMLPHYVWADMREVVADLREAGYGFELDWFAPFFEFRFPHYGNVRIADIDMELRAAIEPWHVLGEESSSQGTARYVDSSVERLQVKLTNLTDSRYEVACNGRRVPLRSTGVRGEYVAGVRYRAWQPPSALHPTIGVDSPLVFDLVDTWNGRSVGGCTYHVSHAGGRSYDDFPVNANAAESRRVTRFWNFGHTPGVIEAKPDLGSRGRFIAEGSVRRPMEPPPSEINPDYPLTLDLRRGR